MRSLLSSTKTIGAAGLLALAAIAISAPSASANTFARCFGDRCVRVHCDWGHCWNGPAYYRGFYHDYDRGFYGGYYGGYGDRYWGCNAWGHDCHWRYY